MNLLDFIKKEEGFRTKAYLDQAGVPTIGYGTIMYEDGSRVKLGDTISQSVAESLLTKDAERRWNAIKHAIKVPINENQKTAIVSITYNIGVGGFLSSTLLKRINSNDTPERIKEAFEMWCKVTIKDKVTGKYKKVVNNGLLNRRKREAKIFFS